MPKFRTYAVARGFLCLVFVMPCQPAAGTVISSVADCTSVGGVGRWSDPANWIPMQVPDNGRPQGTAYDVVVGYGCLSMGLDISVTVNRLFLGAGYWNGAKQKAPKVSANSVSLTVLGDARIDELGMTNGKLDIGGTTWISGSDGWILTDSKVKTGNYRQDFFTVVRFARSTIETSGNFLVTDFAYTELVQSTLETRDLELSTGALSLRDRATVKVKGDFKLGPGFASGLRLQLNSHTDFTVDGNVFLDGTLSGWFSDGYVPSLGEEFPILRAKGSVIGNWTNISLPQLPAGRAWSLIIADRTAYLKVIPAP